MSTHLKRNAAWAVQGDLVSRLCIPPHRQNAAATGRSESKNDPSSEKPTSKKNRRKSKVKTEVDRASPLRAKKDRRTREKLSLFSLKMITLFRITFHISIPITLSRKSPLQKEEYRNRSFARENERGKVLPDIL